MTVTSEDDAAAAVALAGGVLGVRTAVSERGMAILFSNRAQLATRQ